MALASNPPVDVQKFFRRAAKVSYYALAGIIDPEIQLDGQPTLVTATCANEQNMNKVKSALDKLDEDDRSVILNSVISQFMGEVARLSNNLGGPRLRGVQTPISVFASPYVPTIAETKWFEQDSHVSVETVEQILKKNPNLTPSRNLTMILSKLTRLRTEQQIEDKKVLDNTDFGMLEVNPNGTTNFPEHVTPPLNIHAQCAGPANTQQYQPPPQQMPPQQYIPQQQQQQHFQNGQFVQQQNVSPPAQQNSYQPLQPLHQPYQHQQEQGQNNKISVKQYQKRNVRGRGRGKRPY